MFSDDLEKANKAYGEAKLMYSTDPNTFEALLDKTDSERQTASVNYEAAEKEVRDAKLEYDTALAELQEYNVSMIDPVSLFDKCAQCKYRLVLNFFGFCEKASPPDPNEPTKPEFGVCVSGKFGCEKCADDQNCDTCMMSISEKELFIVTLQLKHGSFKHCMPFDYENTCPGDLEFSKNSEGYMCSMPGQDCPDGEVIFIIGKEKQCKPYHYTCPNYLLSTKVYDEDQDTYTKVCERNPDDKCMFRDGAYCKRCKGQYFMYEERCTTECKSLHYSVFTKDGGNRCKSIEKRD